ncbi:MAG: hypothetical protein ABR552_03560 [Actinomycetota bacterium]
MRRPIATLLGLAMMLGFAAIPSAHATYDCSTGGATESNPQLADDQNDYNGAIGGNQSGIPFGDVWGPGTDITEGWISNTGTGQSKWTANIETASLAGDELNAIYTFYFNYPTGDPVQNRKFVEVTVTRPGAATVAPVLKADYGYLDTTGPIKLTTVVGNTTATFTPGSPGKISIVIPIGKTTFFGSPVAGNIFNSLLIETRLLVGAAGTGFLELIDDADGFPCVGAIVS